MIKAKSDYDLFEEVVLFMKARVHFSFFLFILFFYKLIYVQCQSKVAQSL